MQSSGSAGLDHEPREIPPRIAARLIHHGGVFESYGLSISDLQFRADDA
jgi:hypothetical protein